MPKPDKIVERILALKEPHERIGALSLRETTDLDRHPDDYVPEQFESGKLYLRGERQGIQAFPEYNCFLFTIQTWFVDLTEKEKAKVFLKAAEKNVRETYFRHLFEEGEVRGERIMNILRKAAEG